MLAMKRRALFVPQPPAKANPSATTPGEVIDLIAPAIGSAPEKDGDSFLPTRCPLPEEEGDSFLR
jgi:hypothetical protein